MAIKAENPKENSGEEKQQTEHGLNFGWSSFFYYSIFSPNFLSVSYRMHGFYLVLLYSVLALLC